MVDGILRRAGRFTALTLRKAWRDSIAVEASALAFGTVVALVPLLASILIVGQYVFDEYKQEVLGLLARVLPYSESALIEHLNDFLAQAEQMRGITWVSFVLIAVTAFANVETSLNRMWNVPSGRPWRVRLYGFFMLLLWGPLLIGAAYSGLLVLRQRPGFEELFQHSALIRAIPFAVTLLGLTMLYWLVPHTSVRFRCAATGGAAAALLLELLRWGFKFYLRAYPAINLVYGAFAFALFFMISIELFWVIVLLGSEVAYAAQHFKAMSRFPRRNWLAEPAWIGLIALTVLAARRAAGRKPLPQAELARQLELPPEALHQALEPLFSAGFLEGGIRRGDGLALRADPESLKIVAVLGLYEPAQREALGALPPPLAGSLDKLREKILTALGQAARETTVAELLRGPEGAAGAAA